MSFQIDFDFSHHALTLQTSKGERYSIALGPRTVADFYTEVMGRLRGLGLETRIWITPAEILDAIPFEQDRTHCSYDRKYGTRFWRILVQAERVLTRFRGQFLGKVGPAHPHQQNGILAARSKYPHSFLRELRFKAGAIPKATDVRLNPKIARLLE